VRRDRERDVAEDLAQLVVAVAKIAHLLDEVEEGEKREEADQHEQHRRVDLAGEVALERGKPFHRPSLSRMSCMRCANMKISSTAMQACTTHQPTLKSMRPCATRAWMTDKRFEYTT